MRRFRAFLLGYPRTADALLIALPILLFHAPLLAGWRTFTAGDFTQHFLPFSLLQHESLRAGRLALWNPFTYSGHPFLADTQAAVYYPVGNLLQLITLPVHSPAARLYILQVEAVLHTLLAGWFVALLVRTLAGVRWAAVLAGLTFALSGYLVGYPPLQLAVLRTGIWLPLILWLLLQMGRDDGRRWAWALGAGLALATALLAGHPQTFLYIAYITTAWTLLLLVNASARGFGEALRYGAAALLAALVAVALSLAQLLPSVEFTALSVRAQGGYAFAAGGFPLRDSWQLLLPGFLTHYSPLYVGLPGLVLAIAALVAARGRGAESRTPLSLRAATWFFAGLALFGLLLSYGGNGPIYGLVYRLLPGFGVFRGQERAAFMVAFALCLLAGIGAARLYELPDRTRRRLAAASGVLLIASIYAAGLLMQMMGRTAVDNATFLATAIAGLLLAAATALLLWLPPDERLPARLLALTVIGLFLASFGRNFSRATLSEQVALPPEALALAQALHSSNTTATGLPGRAFNEFRAHEDYGMVAGVEDLWGASPLRLARYTRLQEEFPLDRWWNLTGVTHVLTWRRELFVPSTLMGEWPQAEDTTWLHRLDSPAPRARLISGIRVADDEQALALLADHTVPLTSTAILPPEAGIAEQPPDDEAAAADIHMQRLSPEALAVSVKSQGGLLVLSENWMPGLVVEAETSAGDVQVLGLPAWSLVRANLSFVGVIVPAGEEAFTLRYDPPSVRTGLWASGGTLAAVLLALAAAHSIGHGRQRP